MDRLERMNGYPVAIKGKLHRLSNVANAMGSGGTFVGEKG